jgi:hypothetical protein
MHFPLIVRNGGQATHTLDILTTLGEEWRLLGCYAVWLL